MRKGGKRSPRGRGGQRYLEDRGIGKAGEEKWASRYGRDRGTEWRKTKKLRRIGDGRKTE